MQYRFFLSSEAALHSPSPQFNYGGFVTRMNLVPTAKPRMMLLARRSDVVASQPALSLDLLLPSARGP